MSARRERIAIVVHRYFSDVVGGSERHAFLLADLLRESYDVDLLTTRARETHFWKDDEGLADEIIHESLCVKRFPVERGRTETWWKLQNLLEKKGEKRSLSEGIPPWGVGLQELWIKEQGPDAPELIDYLEKNHPEYKKVLYVTYLYPTTFQGIRATPPEKNLLVPTLHDEKPAFFSIFRQMVSRCAYILWNTESEKKFGESLWGERPGIVLGVPLKGSELRFQENRNYYLYSGRIDSGKGVPELLYAYFMAREGKRPDFPELVLSGKQEMKLPRIPGVRILQDLDDRKRDELVCGATAMVVPSRVESLSLVTLEALDRGVPVLGNFHCGPVREHVEKTGAGLLYRSSEELVEILKDPAKWESFREKARKEGRKYVRSQYSPEIIKEKLVSVIEGDRSLFRVRSTGP